MRPAHRIPCTLSSHLAHHVPHALSVTSHMPCLSCPMCPAHPVPHLQCVHPPGHLTWTPSRGPPLQDVSPHPQHHTQLNIPVRQDIQHIWVYPFTDRHQVSVILQGDMDTTAEPSSLFGGDGRYGLGAGLELSLVINGGSVCRPGRTSGALSGSRAVLKTDGAIAGSPCARRHAHASASAYPCRLALQHGSPCPSAPRRGASLALSPRVRDAPHPPARPRGGCGAPCACVNGRFLLTAMLSPRLRVDNGIKIWHCTGPVHVQMIEEDRKSVV